MKTTHENENRSILYKLCLSFAAIIIIPLAVWLILYFNMSGVIIKNTIEYNGAIVESAVKNIKNITDWLNYNTTQIQRNRYLNNIKNFENDMTTEQRYELRLLTEELRNRMVSNPVINEMFIYFPKSDYCVTSRGAFPSEDFYEAYYNGGREEYNKWKAEITEKRNFHQESVTVKSYSESLDTQCISFIQPMAFEKNKAFAVCISMVDEKEFVDAFTVEPNSTPAFAVFNSSGAELIKSEGARHVPDEVFGNMGEGEKTVNGEKFYILHEKINVPSWNVFAVISQTDMLKDVNRVKIWSLVFLLVYIFVCVSVFLLQLQYSYKPVRNILMRIASATNMPIEKNVNEYAAIEQAFREMSTQKQSLKNMLENNENVIRHGFFNSLLNGSVKSDEWEKSKAELGIVPIGSKYAVILCKIEEPENVFKEEDGLNVRERLSLGNFIIDSIFSEVLQSSVYVMSTIVDNMSVYIVNTDRENGFEGVIELCIKETQKIIREYFDFSFITVVSGVHDTYANICEAYDECLAALEHKIFYKDWAIIKYSDANIQHENIYYYYPVEKERQLINYIKSGDFENAENVLNEIYAVNFGNENMNVEFARCLIFNIASTVMKTINELSCRADDCISPNVLESILKCRNIYDMRELLNDMMKNVCKCISPQINENMQQKIIRFIEENYSDSQLAVSVIAEHMGLTSKYLSSVFQEKTGIKLLAYIMQYRISKAKEIFKTQPSVSVGEAAKMVGYESQHTFIRIFKKYEGITPGQYIKMNKGI